MDIYTDYEKIVPHQKLPDFLFHYFHLYETIPWIKNTGEESFYQATELTAGRYNKQKWFLSFLDKVFLALYAKKNLSNSKRRILFRPFKYANIILGAKKYHHIGLIVHGRDRLVAIKNGMGYITTSDLDQYLLAYIKEKNIVHLYHLISKIENKLKVAKPDYVMLWNDITPMERAIALVSKKLGITTVEIHHGIYDEIVPMETGKIADYVLVWGKYFKDLYVNRYKRKPENIYVLGYPYAIKQHQTAGKKNSHYAVCYLGQSFEIYNKKFLNTKIETIKKIHEICNRLGMDFIYRPHPADDRELLKKNLADTQFTDIGEELEEVFKKADILISFSSTALIEAAMRSKIALQLMSYPLKSDNFEKLGACSASLQTIEELEDYLKKIVSAKTLDEFKITFNNDYVETRYNPVGRFLEIIKEIEERKKS